MGDILDDARKQLNDARNKLFDEALTTKDQDWLLEIFNDLILKVNANPETSNYIHVEDDLAITQAKANILSKIEEAIPKETELEDCPKTVTVQWLRQNPEKAEKLAYINGGNHVIKDIKQSLNLDKGKGE